MRDILALRRRSGERNEERGPNRFMVPMGIKPLDVDALHEPRQKVKCRRQNSSSPLVPRPRAPVPRFNARSLTSEHSVPVCGAEPASARRRPARASRGEGIIKRRHGQRTSSRLRSAEDRAWQRRLVHREHGKGLVCGVLHAAHLSRRHADPEEPFGLARRRRDVSLSDSLRTGDGIAHLSPGPEHGGRRLDPIGDARRAAPAQGDF